MKNKSILGILLGEGNKARNKLFKNLHLSDWSRLIKQEIAGQLNQSLQRKAVCLFTEEKFVVIYLKEHNCLVINTDQRQSTRGNVKQEWRLLVHTWSVAGYLWLSIGTYSCLHATHGYLCCDSAIGTRTCMCVEMCMCTHLCIHIMALGSPKSAYIFSVKESP